MIKSVPHFAIWSLIASCLLATLLSKAQAAPDIDANQLKAAYLIHMSEFTMWPDDKAQLPNFTICLGLDSVLKDPLEEIRGRPVKGKPLSLEYDVPAEKLPTCHILYVEPNQNRKQFQQIVQKEGILTVGDDYLPGFAKEKEGGIIEYYRVDEKIKMKVNLRKLQQSKITMSSKLLRLMTPEF